MVLNKLTNAVDPRNLHNGVMNAVDRAVVEKRSAFVKVPKVVALSATAVVTNVAAAATQPCVLLGKLALAGVKYGPMNAVRTFTWSNAFESTHSKMPNGSSLAATTVKTGALALGIVYSLTGILFPKFNVRRQEELGNIVNNRKAEEAAKALQAQQAAEAQKAIENQKIADLKRAAEQGQAVEQPAPKKDEKAVDQKPDVEAQKQLEEQQDLKALQHAFAKHQKKFRPIAEHAAFEGANRVKKAEAKLAKSEYTEVQKNDRIQLGKVVAKEAAKAALYNNIAVRAAKMETSNRVGILGQLTNALHFQYTRVSIPAKDLYAAFKATVDAKIAAYKAAPVVAATTPDAAPDAVAATPGAAPVVTPGATPDVAATTPGAPSATPDAAAATAVVA